MERSFLKNQQPDANRAAELVSVLKWPICPISAFEEKYALKAKGYGFDRMVSRVAELMGIRTDQVTERGKSQQTVKARELLCYWAHIKLNLRVQS
jgi:hypothetical protein